MNNLLPLPVLLPLLASGLALALGRKPNAQRLISTTSLLIVLIIEGYLIYLTDQSGPIALSLGAWPSPLGVSVVVDRLSALMLFVSTLVSLTVLVFSIGSELEERRRQTPVSIYHPTFLLLTAGVSAAFIAGDLFNMFVGFEVLLFASYVLLTLGGTAERVRAGITYVIVNLLSSILFLVTIAVIYAATGTVNMAELSVRLAELPPELQLALQLMLLTVFSIKAAVFPLSAWLPDSYPTAPAPVTAVFAGLLTKVGVYAIIRTQTLLFPDSPLEDLLLWAALLTMVIGILGAVAQSDIKRLLSFTLISHIGYMIMGIALATEAGLAGAIFYTAHHITIQTTLFLVTGLIEVRGGSTSLNKLGGLAALSPMLGVLFFIPAMNLAGIPPFSGFIGKIGLLSAGVESGHPLSYPLVISAVLTSLLTLYAVAKVWNRAFWREIPDEVRSDGTSLMVQRRWVRLPQGMVVTAGVLVLIGMGITVIAGPLYGYTDRAAIDILAVEPYLRAVLPAEYR
ncbi:Na+/H+ antiporter subunit D [Naumannella halotolerans]|uniref:Multicomponent Na+:H+ antiporter subunit D n=1 Tax=Naumannella halotolerans TaxID=993414 RepID=A0A4R7JB28_9ACTN|nr:Na+/H+ antiporter subunit D [Naumannella halotolerans]TDT34136.1 multicomponent Na+:H+ antiporter subunit D [Naumannella halotolerans]